MQNTSDTTVNILISLKENIKRSVPKKLENIILKIPKRDKRKFLEEPTLYHTRNTFVVHPPDIQSEKQPPHSASIKAASRPDKRHCKPDTSFKPIKRGRQAILPLQLREEGDWMFIQRPKPQGSKEKRFLVLFSRRRKAAKAKAEAKRFAVEFCCYFVCPGSHTLYSCLITCSCVGNHAFVGVKQLFIPAIGKKEQPCSDLPFEMLLLFC